MSVHGPLIFVLLIDKCVESTHVSKPVSTLTVHTVLREGMDGGEQEKKKVHSPTILPLFPRVSLRTLKLNTKGIITRFRGNCPPTPPLSQHYHLRLT